jgi:hypothetical protein
MCIPGAQGSKRPTRLETRKTAIDHSAANETSEETRPSLTKDAPVASSGGVGAVRRNRPRLGRAGTLGLVAVLGLLASGTGNAVLGLAAPHGSHVLNGRVHRAATGPVVAPAAEEVAAAPDGVAPTVEAGPTSPPEAVVDVPPTSAPSVDKPIVAPPTFARTRAAGVRSSRTNYASRPREGGVWAVVVGIDDYPGTDADLNAAVADAREVDRTLAAYGVPGNHRLVLLDKQASGDHIRGALAWMTSQATADSTAVFFYSGHVRQVAGDPDHDGEAVDEAIVAADGDNVYDGQVADLLRNLEARSAWLSIAACYGAGFDDALAPGRILTAAAGENDVAYENSSLGRSYMVEYMVRRAMLQGKAPGSVQDAFNWARAQIARDYPNRQPVVVDRARGPVVLGRLGADRKPAAQPPQSNPQPGAGAPPPAAPEPKPSGPCAEVLGVSVCSEKRSSGPHVVVGPARPAEPRLD